jgi:hypothetical protein
MLICGSLWLQLPGSAETDRPEQVPPPSGKPRTEEPAKGSGDPERKVMHCPFGLVHDFGKLQPGVIAKHEFAIANNSCSLLRINSIRVGGCSEHGMVVESTKSELRRGEQAKICVTWEAGHFVGAKSKEIYVEMENGETVTYLTISVSAEGQLELPR